MKDTGTELIAHLNGIEVLRYVYRPEMPETESPKPYFHPLRTLSGNIVTGYRPHDHRWHKGLQMTASHVSGQNFWGGGTYVHGSGYVDLPNNGTIRHEEWLTPPQEAPSLSGPTPPRGPLSRSQPAPERLSPSHPAPERLSPSQPAPAPESPAATRPTPGSESPTTSQPTNAPATSRQTPGPEPLPPPTTSRDRPAGEHNSSTNQATERLTWWTRDGEHWIDELRTFSATPTADAWTLDFATTLTNTRSEDLLFGSPTTHGRPMAGYSGLFWRGPRSFTNGHTIGPDMGEQGQWLAYIGTHDEVDATSTLLFTSSDPNQTWFVRADPFAAVNPSIAFSKEVRLKPGESMHLSYRLVIADGTWDRPRIESHLKAHP
ncbi:DUF6807 family protein [Nonomuraea sp. NPDC050556]|uniref:DUF6807 domain-containing protein n=1 Tax=Nonomuraea sp. NPDC050556 TaxID=3364369 RepID=UPI0037B0EF7E